MHQLISSRALARRWRSALLATIAVLSVAAMVTAGLVVVAPSAPAATDVTTCHDASLSRRATNVDVDLAVTQFDPTLGVLLEVMVPSQTVHLDTDAAFESTASSSELVAERMTYDVAFTSPGGLASSPVLTGSIDRVPSQTVAAFDGVLDFAGPSSVTQPSTVRDLTAAVLQSTAPAVLAAFTGVSTIPFHLTATANEDFTSGGGNVAFLIHTFVSAAVTVCYRYTPAQVPVPPTVPVTTPPVDVPVNLSVDAPVIEVRFTG